MVHDKPHSLMEVLNASLGANASLQQAGPWIAAEMKQRATWDALESKVLS